MSFQMTKEEQRKYYLQQRNNFSQKEIRNLNERLTQEIFNFIKASKVSSVFLFLPIKERNEFDTFPLINLLWHAGVKVAVPVSDFKNHEMRLAVFNVGTELVEKKYGILEPAKAEFIHSGDIELALVPLLIADKKNNRLGYGGGFYDRFLSQNKHIYKLGVSYFKPVHEIAGLEDHDVPLDKVIY